MAALDIEFRGPLDRSFRRRFRPRNMGAAVATGVALLVLVTELNLTGVWQTAGDPNNGTVWKIRHTGRSVEGTLRDGTPSFSARFANDLRLEGRINLFWLEERMIAVCGSGYPDVFETVRFVADIDPDFDAMELRYSRSVHSGEDCSFQRRERVTVRLVRRND